MLVFEAGSPAWAQRAGQRISEAFSAITNPQKPRPMPEYVSTLLPDPVRYRSCDIYVSDLTMTAFSDGTHWRRSDTGVAL